MARKIFVVTVMALLVLAGGGFLSGCGDKEKQQSPETGQTGSETETKPINVVVEELLPQTVEESFTLPGTLEAWEDVTLSLEQSGPITWVGPREGDRLKAGDEILRIDKEALEAQHVRNETQYEIKRKQLERADSLHKEQLISDKERDDVYQAYQDARTSLTETRIAIEKSTLLTPIDGILDQLLVDRGEFGNVGTPAAVVVQIHRLKVLVDVPEKDVTSVRTGQTVTVFPAGVEGDKGVGRTGKVNYVSYQADEMTRTYLTKVRIDNRDGYLRPGMIVRVRFVRRVLENVLAVPLYAVLDRDGQKFVFVEEDGTAVRREVHLGPVVNGKVVIFGGVQEGEKLVIKGQQLIADSGPIRVVEEE